jgi:hypothetical protein
LFAFYQQQHDPSLAIMSIAFLISGLVIGSRWFLKKHTLLELVLGFFIAFLLAWQAQ